MRRPSWQQRQQACCGLLMLVLLAAAAGGSHAAHPAAAGANSTNSAVHSIADGGGVVTAAAATARSEQQQKQQQQQPALALAGSTNTSSSSSGGGRRNSALSPEDVAAARAAPLRASARPAPRYEGYSLAVSRDTFDICRNQSGRGQHEIGLDALPALYGLPASLLRWRRVSGAQLAAVVAEAAPRARLVLTPMAEVGLPPVAAAAAAGGGGNVSSGSGSSGGRGSSTPSGDRPLGSSSANSSSANSSSANSGGGGARLPRLVHFTVRNKAAMLPHQALSIATWARLNPGYTISVYDDADVAAFMAAHHPEALPLFWRLDSQVERTDLWRYLVLCTLGGVYADSDVVAGRPVDEWAQDAGLLTGVENVFEALPAARARDYTRLMQVVQWTIAAAPGHPVVCRMGEYIRRRVDAEAAGAVPADERDHAILERTGPGIWSSSVHDYLRAHGVVPESAVGGAKVGDVRLLPQSVFGCASSTVNLSDPMAYAYHQFKGSWRLALHERLLQGAARLLAALFGGSGGGAGGGGGSGILARGGAAAGGAAAAGGPQAEGQQARDRRSLRVHASAAALRDALPASWRHPAADAPGMLPLVPLLAVLALVGVSLGRRSGSRCGRPCGGAGRAFSGGSGVLLGLFGAAGRLALRWRGGGGGGGGAGLLPLAQLSPCHSPSRKASPLEQPLLPPADRAAVVAAPSAPRQQGGSSGCLKRSANSMQCLQSAGGV
jgi:hypothetical protein